MYVSIGYSNPKLINFHELNKYLLEFFEFSNQLIQNFKENFGCFYLIILSVVTIKILSNNLTMKLQD